jgi:uncharacterized protein (TIGR02099 family)
MTLPAAMGQQLALDLKLTGDPWADPDWRGTFYAKVLRLRLNQGPVHASLDSLLGLTVTAGVCDALMWGEVGASGLKRVRAEGTAFDLAIRKLSSEATLALPRLAGIIEWKRQRDGWRLSGQHLTLSLGPAGGKQSRWPLSDFHVAVRQDRYEVSASFLRLQDASALGLASRRMDPTLREVLSGLQPAGDIHHLNLAYQPHSGHRSGLTLRGRFVDLKTRSWWGLPGVRGLDGTLRVSGQDGVLALESRGAELDYRPVLRWPLALALASGRITWQRGAGQWRIATDRLLLRNDDLAARVSSALTLFDDGGSPHLDLRANLEHANAAAVPRYLPVEVIPEGVVKWLDHAFVSGHIPHGTVVIRGRLADFPFVAGNGEFEVDLQASDGVLRYRPDWPLLTQVKARVQFRGREMAITGQSGRVLSSDIQETEVTIPNLTARPAVLQVRGVAEGLTQDALRFVAQSPLNEKFGTYLEDVSAKGSSKLYLDLVLPLNKDPAQVNGRLILRDTHLSLPHTKITLSQLNGPLQFSERGLRSESLTGRLWGEKVQLSVDRRGAEERTVVEARGAISAGVLREHLPHPWGRSLHGRTRWRGSLRLPPAGRSEAVAELHLSSELAGLAVDLPAPLRKSASEAESLSLIYRLQGKERSIKLRYGKRLSAALALRNGPVGLMPERGELRLGGEAAEIPAQLGISIAGHTPELSVDAWRSVLPEGSGDASGGKSPSTMPGTVRQIKIAVGRLDLLGQRLHAVSLKAHRQGNRWLGTVSSEEAAGGFTMQFAGNTPLVKLDLERLRLTPLRNIDERQHLDPAAIPPLKISSARLSYQDIDLGGLRLETTRHHRGLHLKTLKLHGPAMNVDARGDWLIENGQQVSRSTVTLQADDLGKALALFGYAGNVHGGETHVDIVASWPGTPADFSLARMSGDLRFKVGKGQLLGLDPGMGRAFGLLSLQALPRRLHWDFSDLFGKGFGFDQIQGHFSIRNGEAALRGLSMEGPAARVDIAGKVDLRAQTYDQLVSVTPHLTSGLPVAGALAGGLGAGAALFVVQKLLQRPIEKLASYQYKVTGHWNSPVVTRLTRMAPSPAQ